MREILIYAAGWLLFVAAQAQNSVSSTANGLTGSTGFARWIRYQWVNLATRGFFSGIFYGWIIHFVCAKIQAAGLAVTGIACAGVAGYAANALLYQVFGLLPWLRVEVHDLAPPAQSQPNNMVTIGQPAFTKTETK